MSPYMNQMFLYYRYCCDLNEQTKSKEFFRKSISESGRFVIIMYMHCNVEKKVFKLFIVLGYFVYDCFI